MPENNVLQLIKQEKTSNDLIVKHVQTGNACSIVDTFAEMFTAMEISPVFPFDIDIAKDTWVKLS